MMFNICLAMASLLLLAVIAYANIIFHRKRAAMTAMQRKAYDEEVEYEARWW